MFGLERLLRRDTRRRMRPGRGLPPVLPARSLLERRQVVLAVAGLSYAGVLALQQVNRDPSDAIGLLYVVPIALIALELGLVAGVASALGATALIVVWWSQVHASWDLISILTWTAAFVAVGGVGGWFSDRMRAAQHRQRLLLQSGLALMRLGDERRLAGELATQARRILAADEVRVEPIAAGPTPDGLTGHEQRVALEAGGACHGTLVFTRSRPLSADDQTAVSILAWQAAVAAENARLLEVERERAVMRNDLRHARLHLDDRATQLRQLIDRIEAERTHVADELHEQAAQMLAGVLLDLAALDRELKTQSADANLDQLRTDVGSTMSSLRELAVGLRPSVLALGLPTALEELVDAHPGATASTVEVAGVGDIDPETTLLVYRAVEEALLAVPDPDRISIRTRGQDRTLAIELHTPPGRIDQNRLTVLRARVEVLGGELQASDDRLAALLPLAAQTVPAGAPPRSRPAIGDTAVEHA